MPKRLGGIIGCKYKTSSWHLNGLPDGSNIGSTVSCVCVSVCVCVLFPFILDISSLDVPAMPGRNPPLCLVFNSTNNSENENCQIYCLVCPKLKALG